MRPLEDLYQDGFRNGDIPAQEEFVRQATPALLAFVRGALGTRGTDSQEIVADAISRAVTKGGRIDLGRPLLPYLRTVALNVVRDRKRREAREQRALPKATLQATDGSDPIQELAGRTTHPWVRVHVEGLLAAFQKCAEGILSDLHFQTLRALMRNWWDNETTANELNEEPTTIAVRKARIKVETEPCRERLESGA